jgi:hypothetical protein
MAKPTPREVAAQRLAELFKSPEVFLIRNTTNNTQDLSKIDSFRTRFQREKATIDAQLKAGIRAQLELTQVLCPCISD